MLTAVADFGTLGHEYKWGNKKKTECNFVMTVCPKNAIVCDDVFDFY